MADFDDVGDEGDSLSDIDENMGDVDEENEETARARLQELYQQNPDLAALQVSSIKKSDGRLYATVFLGPESRLHNSGSGKKSNASENNVDWKATLKYVIQRIGLLEIRDISIRNKDPRAKRRVFDALVANTQMNKELEIRALDSITNMYQNVPNKMKYLEDNLGVYPLDKTQKIHTEFGLRYDRPTDQIRIINRETGYDYMPFYKVVNWVNTLEYILARAEAIGLDLNRVDPTKRAALGSPQTTPSDTRRQPKIHRTEGVSVANKPITNIKIYQEIEFILARSPFLEFNSNRLHPFASGKFNKTYYFGSAPDIDNEDNSTRGGLELYNGKSDNPMTNNSIWQKIDWDKTLEEAILILKRIRSRAKEGDVVRQINETLQLIGASPPDGSEDQDFVYNPRPTARSAMLNIKGRGLMGAGCKNLKHIEGSGTASDLKYKRIGSKFIRVADLRSNRLKLVYPNRTPLGKLRDITPKLAQLINTLLFDKDIDQQLYGELPVSDKKLFCEILKATHLQHQFSNTLDDPIESLRAEFDKLRGQVMLGNDNPDVIRELKAISVDLYGQKIITEEEFKQIVLNL